MSKRTAARVEDETRSVKNAKNGEIAAMLHKDMMAHRKRTADFNNKWKGTLCLASVALALVSIWKAAENARDGSPQWMERSITSANSVLIGIGVQVEDRDNTAWFRLSHMVALALSVYQLVDWWTSRQNGEEVDFPVDVILLVVAMAAIVTMTSTLRAADRAYQASGALAQKISAKPKKNRR